MGKEVNQNFTINEDGTVNRNPNIDRVKKKLGNHSDPSGLPNKPQGNKGLIWGMIALAFLIGALFVIYMIDKCSNDETPTISGIWVFKGTLRNEIGGDDNISIVLNAESNGKCLGTFKNETFKDGESLSSYVKGTVSLNSFNVMADDIGWRFIAERTEDDKYIGTASAGSVTYTITLYLSR